MQRVIIPHSSQGIPPSDDCVNHGTKLLLSVDDEPGILSTRQCILENAGYAVLSACNGDQALSLFAAQSIDLVLLDFLMPGMDGGTVCLAMKRLRPHVPVLMISGSDVRADTLTSVNGFLGKGEGPASLLREIERLLADPPGSPPLNVRYR